MTDDTTQPRCQGSLRYCRVSGFAAFQERAARRAPWRQVRHATKRQIPCASQFGGRNLKKQVPTPIAQGQAHDRRGQYAQPLAAPQETRRWRPLPRNQNPLTTLSALASANLHAHEGCALCPMPEAIRSKAPYQCPVATCPRVAPPARTHARHRVSAVEGRHRAIVEGHGRQPWRGE